MRNRAKCKLCHDILESFHRHDYVTCKCGEISIDGGNTQFKASAKDWRNFFRIDDDGKEIEVKVIEKKNKWLCQPCGQWELKGTQMPMLRDCEKCGAKDQVTFICDIETPSHTIVNEETPQKLSRKDMIGMLEEMVKSYEKLPQNVMYEPINHADFCSALMLIASILKEE